MKKINLKRNFICLFKWFCLVIFVTGNGQGVAQENTFDSRYLSLKAGEVSVIYVPGIKRVAIGNPDVVNYKTIDDSQVMLIGVGAGKTNVHVWGEGDRQIRYWISVDQRHLNHDVEVAKALLKSLDRVQVYQLEEKIVIEGEIYKEDAVKISAVKDLLPNAVVSVTERKVTRGQTIRIDAVLVEISNGDLRRWVSTGRIVFLALRSVSTRHFSRMTDS